MSRQPTVPEAVVAAFSFNKNLQHAKLEWRFNERFTDPEWATAYVGAELLAQQERAAKRYEQQAVATRAAIDEQTRQNAEHARILKATIEESSEAVRREVSNVGAAVKENTAELRGLATQVTQLAWLQVEQNRTLQHILALIRESRANECRQLVDQGERNFRAGYLAEAEERFKLALTYDSTDYMTHQNLGLTYIRLGRPDTALEHFKKAWSFPPKAGAKEQRFFIVRAATHAARTCYAMGDYAQAEKYFIHALENEKTNAKNAYDLGVVRAYQGKIAEAIEALSAAIDLDPTLAGAALADAELEAMREDIEILILERTADRFNAAKDAMGDLATMQKKIADIGQEVGVTIDTSADARPLMERVQKRGPSLLTAHEAVRGIAALRRSLRDRAVQTLAAARTRATTDSTQGHDARWREKQAIDAQADQRDKDLVAAVRAGGPSTGAAFLVGIVCAVVGAFIGANTIHGIAGALLVGALAWIAGIVAYRLYATGRVASAKEALDQFRSERASMESRYAVALQSERTDAGTRAQEIERAIAAVQAIP